VFTTNHALLPDPELITACLDGHADAWEALLQRYARLIYTIPLRYGLSESDAGDVFQNVSVLLLKNLRYLRDRERLGGYITTITRRESWRLIRRLQAEGDIEPEILDTLASDSSRLEEEFQRLEQQAILHTAVSQIGERCTRLLTLLFYHEPRLSYQEIAAQVGIPEGSIGPTRARCIEKLIHILQKAGFSLPDK
jgi:RNA polymerase sigma factor (sigma-70 family)